MQAFLTGLSFVLIALAIGVVVMNYAAAMLSARNKRLGIDKHHSMVFLVAQLLLWLAAVASPVVPRWVLFAIAAADLSLWMLLYLPIFLLLQRFR